MVQQSWRARIAAYLESKGYRRITGGKQSERYLKYQHGSGFGKFYHLGKAGACLVSTKPGVTGAVSVTDTMHRQVVLWERDHAESA